MTSHLDKALSAIVSKQQSRNAPLHQILNTFHTRAIIVCGASGSVPTPEALESLRESLYAIEEACICDNKFKWKYAKAPKNTDSINVKVDRQRLRELLDTIHEIDCMMADQPPAIRHLGLLAKQFDLSCEV